MFWNEISLFSSTRYEEYRQRAKETSKETGITINATLRLCKLKLLGHEKAIGFAGTKPILMNIGRNETGAET